jgi:hypothetical protein
MTTTSTTSDRWFTALWLLVLPLSITGAIAVVGLAAGALTLGIPAAALASLTIVMMVIAYRRSA